MLIPRMLFDFEYFKPQQLILVNLDDEIKIGDRYLIGGNIKTCMGKEDFGEENYLKNDLGNYNNVKFCRKVIATQEQLPLDYINKFIKKYNTKGIIEDVEIEMDLFWNNGGKIQPFPNTTVTEKDRVYKLKLTDGHITIIDNEELINTPSIFKPIYTEDEVREILKKYKEHLMDTIKIKLDVTIPESDFWFENDNILNI